MKKLILLLLFTSLMILSNGQTISFIGYRQSVYQQPIQLPNNKWDAMYENSDVIYMRGEIIINDKSFEIYYTNGQSWIANIKKKEIKNNLTIYKGVWKDDQDDAKLVVTSINGTPTTFQLYSHRIINTGVPGVMFNDWECYRKITTFYN